MTVPQTQADRLSTIKALRDAEAVALMTSLWEAGVRPASMEEKKG